MKEKILKRLEDLRAQARQLEGQLNATYGAIETLEDLMREGEQSPSSPADEPHREVAG